MRGIDVPDEECLLGQAPFSQDVLDLDGADQVVSGEAVKVVDAELEDPVRQLLIGHVEGEGLVELRVKRLPVDLRLVFVLAVRHKVDLKGDDGHVTLAFALAVLLVSNCISTSC